MDSNNTNTITFTVEGRVQGKGRARFNSYTKRTYTPASTKDYEREIAYACKQVMIQQGFKTIEPKIPTTLTVVAYMKNATSKPDGDNILKVVADALNGIAYADDSQIITQYINKVSHSIKRKLQITIGVING